MQLIKVFNIDIRINSLLLVTFIFFFLCGNLENALISFIIVFLHEWGHTIVALLLGYHIDYIELFPFGGVAKVTESIGIDPRHEIIIAAAGPTVNFVLVLISYQLANFFSLEGDSIRFFVVTNIMIGFFNLLPLVPLDGGRILRAYIAYFLGFKRATRISTWISKMLCLALFVLGIYIMKYNALNIFLSMIAVFVYMAAQKERDMAAFVFMKDIMQKKQFLLSKGTLKTKHIIAVDSTRAKEILDQFLPRKYHIITVVDRKCNIMGTLTENQVFDGIIKYGMNTTLDELFTKE